MWIEFIGGISSKYTFGRSATDHEIQQLEKIFNVKIPNELRSLLSESNGIKEQADDLDAYFDLIWSVSRIQEENMNLRNDDDFKDLYMPFDCLLFFADAGNGDLFGYSIQNGVVQRDDIFAWNHEDDSRTWVAPCLKTFIEWWSEGRIRT